MAQFPVESPTLRTHRRQFFWQIILPLLVVLALIVTGAVFVTIGDESLARLWADVSIVWLIAPVLIIALLGIVLLGLLIYAMVRLTKVMPRFTSRAQEVAMRIRSGTHKVADKSVEPILWTKQAGSVLETIMKALLRRSRSKKP